MLRILAAHSNAIFAVTVAGGMGHLQPRTAFTAEAETAQPQAPKKKQAEKTHQSYIAWASESSDQRAKRLAQDAKRNADAKNRSESSSPASKLKRHPAGWLIREDSSVKMNNGEVVVVFKPTVTDFIRLNRYVCKAVPTLFENGLFMSIKDVDYSLPKAQDAVCMGCFGPIRSPLFGQSNLTTHSKVCKSYTPEQKAFLSTPTTSSLADARRVIVSEQGVLR
jgi:hypothetical protein